MSVKSGTSAFSLGSGSSSRRSSKVYEPELVSSVDEALLAELATTPAPWTHKSLYGPKPTGVPANPPPERFVVQHMLGFRRFLPDPRWWDTHGHELPLGGEGKRQLMVLRFGMRVPYPVEQVYRWFEQIVLGLRARAEHLIRESPWRAWPLASLLVVLREHAWSDAGRQRQLHTAQSKGLSALVALAHRWSLQYLDEKADWRSGTRRVVLAGGLEAKADRGIFAPGRDKRLEADPLLRVKVKASLEDPSGLPLPYTSGPDWTDGDPKRSSAKAIERVAQRNLARAHARLVKERNEYTLRRPDTAGGDGTGRDLVELPHPSPRSLEKERERGPRKEGHTGTEVSDPGSVFLGAPNGGGPGVTGSDRVLGAMATRGEARRRFTEQFASPLELNQAAAAAWASAPARADAAARNGDPRTPGTPAYREAQAALSQGGHFPMSPTSEHPLIARNRAAAASSGFASGSASASASGRPGRGKKKAKPPPPALQGPIRAPSFPAFALDDTGGVKGGGYGFGDGQGRSRHPTLPDASPDASPGKPNS
eukprot:CAMPEP_0172621900 /NCGR_PEP_ID=MMETSP1068-20121228/116411_1 /TAXON_ID=35684 /ORGANISM="Pseudopedinella elastica, Strain CCMP716" /LENGTH=537 /DNA_ID=CAMNT_0013429871 /DNA_START=98 /DNA_END=1708 /DNA_ORIENTATION=-